MDERNRGERTPLQPDSETLKQQPTQMVIETATESGVGRNRTVKTEANDTR
jgi:hypothetical protein